MCNSVFLQFTLNHCTDIIRFRFVYILLPDGSSGAHALANLHIRSKSPITRHTVPNVFNFTSNLMMLFFVQPLSENSVANCGALCHSCTFLIKILSSLLNDAMLTGTVTCNLQNSCYFRCLVWKLIKLIKSKLTQKLKHANSILEYLEYFCQMSFELYRFKVYAFFETQCTVYSTRKLSYCKDDRAMRRMYGCPEIFRESLTTPMATFPKIFNGLLFRLSL